MAATSGGDTQQISYSNMVKSNSNVYPIEVHLVRYERSIPYNLTDEQKSNLAFNKIGIPKGKLSYIDDSSFRRIDFYVSQDVPKSALNLNTAFELMPGLRTKPVSVKRRETWVNIYWTAVNDDDKDIIDSLSYFGIVTSSVQHMTYRVSEKDKNNEALKLLEGVKKGDRKVRMKIHKNIPSYIIIGGKRVKVTFEGQLKTCARCHDIWQDCPGKGVPDKCEELNGPKNELSKIWETFTSQNGHVTDLEETEESSRSEIDSEEERTAHKSRIFELSGIPVEAQACDLLEWLTKECKIPVDIDDLQPLSSPGRWKITNLTLDEMKEYRRRIFGKTSGNNKVYVSIYIPSTPKKTSAAVPIVDDSSSLVDDNVSPTDQESEAPVIQLSSSSDEPRSSPSVQSASPSSEDHTCTDTCPATCKTHISETESNTEPATPCVSKLKTKFELNKTAGGTMMYKIVKSSDSHKDAITKAAFRNCEANLKEIEKESSTGNTNEGNENGKRPNEISPTQELTKNQLRKKKRQERKAKAIAELSNSESSPDHV